MDRKSLLLGAKRFPDFFPEGRAQYYYVDKTGLIKDLISTGFLDASPQLVLRPRRFGKTLALSMLKTFFDLDEKDKAWMFSDLAIAQDKELCERYQNKYPVISISLKDTESTSYEDLIHKLNTKLKREAQRFHVAIISELGFDGRPRDIFYDREDRDALLRISVGKGTEDDLMHYFSSLTHMLYGYYRVKPLVFVDEYDAPLNSAFSHEYLEDAVSLMRGMFSSGLKANDSLGGVVITGIFQIAKSSILSGLINLVVNSVVNGGDYPEAFGFTQEEVDSMLAYYSIEDRRDILKDWYDGYRIGGVDVYNPFSLSSSVKNLCRRNPSTGCENYWLDTGGTSLLKEMLLSCKDNPELKMLFDRLLEGDSVEAGYATSVVYSDILESTETILGALLLSGYLTKCDDQKLRIPDKEVLSGFANLCKWYNKEADEEMLPELVRAYVEDRPEDAAALLDEYFEDTLRARDLNSSENNYHYFICGAMSQVRKSLGAWSFHSNEQKKLGYADLVFVNRREKRAIIIEEKAIREGCPLRGESRKAWRDRQVSLLRDEALRQIHDTEYDYIDGYDVTVYVNVYYKHRAWVFRERC